MVEVEVGSAAGCGGGSIRDGDSPAHAVRGAAECFSPGWVIARPLGRDGGPPPDVVAEFSGLCGSPGVWGRLLRGDGGPPPGVVAEVAGLCGSPGVWGRPLRGDGGPPPGVVAEVAGLCGSPGVWGRPLRGDGGSPASGVGDEASPSPTMVLGRSFIVALWWGWAAPGYGVGVRRSWRVSSFKDSTGRVCGQSASAGGARDCRRARRSVVAALKVGSSVSMCSSTCSRRRAAAVGYPSCSRLRAVVNR